MKQLSLLFTIVLLTYFKSHSIDTTTIIYNDFGNLTSWQLNGTARGATGTESEKVLRLTQNKTSQSGSAFIKNPIKLVSDKGFMASFSAYFAFRMSNTGGLDEGDGAGADGIVFVIQTVANNVGSVGGGLGYRGIKKSIGIEFDTWNNADSSNDPDHNHLGVDTNGTTNSITTFSEQSFFNNGKIWYAWIDYDGDNQLLEVRYDSLNNRPADPKISQKINIPSLLVVENVYVGFTSATGASYNTHDILAFNFVNKFQPYLYSMSLSARPDTIVNVLDTVTLIATIRDMSNTIQVDSSKKAQWRIISDGGNPFSILLDSTGSEVKLVPQVGGTEIKIESKAIVYGQTLIDTIAIHVNELHNFSLDITATPDTNVKSHDTVLLKAVVLDNKNRQIPDSVYKTTWEIIANDGNPDDILKSTSGAQVICVPETAFSTVSIMASVLINNILITDTIHLHVGAGDPYRLSIEKRPFLRQSGINLETITLTTDIGSDSVFAVVRDKWGALCSVADSLLTNWNIVFGRQIARVTGIENLKYTGYIERMSSDGYAVVEVSQGQLITDSVVVRVSGIIFDKIAIRDINTGLILDSLIAKVGQARSLMAIGCIAGLDPALETSWIPLNASWMTSGDIAFKNALPTGNSQWELIADNAGKGTLTIKYGNFENCIPFTIISQNTPFLVRAVYVAPGDGTAKKTMKLYFSEDVNCSMLSTALPVNTLTYKNSAGQMGKSILDGAAYQSGKSDLFASEITIILTDAADLIVPDKDSIAITGGTVNQHGVGPDNQHPVFVPVEIQGGFITITATSNPFNIRQAISTVVPSQILSYYSNVIKNNNGNGVIIAVYSSVTLKQFGEHFGSAVIYDALGNIVSRGLKLDVANMSTKTDYGIYWNGKNEKGRFVGQGTYLVRIPVIDMKGSKNVLELKIGVVGSDINN